MGRKEFYSVEEVAVMLNLDMTRVYYLIRTGVVRGEKRQKSPLSTCKVWKLSHDEFLRLEGMVRDA